MEDNNNNNLKGENNGVKPDVDDIDEVFKIFEKKAALNGTDSSSTTPKEQYEEALQQSCGTHHTRVTERKTNAVKPSERRVIVKIVAIALVGALTFKGIIDVQGEIHKRIEYYADGKEAVSIATDEAMQRLKDNGLAAVTKDGETVLLADNDYSVLKASTPEEIFAYYKALDDSEEFEKFIQDTSYENGYANYTSMEQFLRINGFIDPETNKPSIKVWENITKDHLITSYRNGEIESIFSDFSDDDLYTNNGTFDYAINFNTGHIENGQSEGRRR